MGNEVKLIESLASVARIGYGASRPRTLVSGIVPSVYLRELLKGQKDLAISTKAEDHWFLGDSELVENQGRLQKVKTGFDFSVDNLDVAYIGDSLTFGRLTINVPTLTGTFALRYLQCKKNGINVPVEELLVFIPNTSLQEVHRCVQSLGSKVAYDEFLKDIDVFKGLDAEDALEDTYDDDDAPIQ